MLSVLTQQFKIYKHHFAKKKKRPQNLKKITIETHTITHYC